MNKSILNIKWVLALAAMFAFAACDTDVEHKIPEVDAPAMVSSVPANNAVDVRHGNTTITVKYNKNIFFATSRISEIALTGEGSIVDANVYGSSTDLVISARLGRGKSYTLSIPEGVVTGPNQMPAPAVTLQFTTGDITSTLVNSAATESTKKVYNYLLDNYGAKTLSATVANANWNTDEAERVFEITGKYPAMNCFDYIHLPSSPSNWIDYSDISPVKNWWDAGGIVLGMWHWNVPVSEDSTDEYAFYKADTRFDADNATIEGTWENEVVKADLAKVTSMLKLLQDAGIVVIWRPFHEAAGGWFWWGKNAESCKALWITMFNYFKAEGLNNLIWVWTTETGDEDWYPGDAYVDIVGRDLYNKDVATVLNEYEATDGMYPNKLAALTECGSVALLSEQWTAGARWSWFMPWYGKTDSGEPHGTDDWWTNAMSQTYVVSRDQLPSFK